MPIAFNFKVCDNAPECNGIANCPLKLIKWDNKQQTLVVNNDKCTACGLCAKSCPVPGAILVAKNDEEFAKIKADVEADPRTRAELLEDRYGTAPTDQALVLTMKNFDEEVLQSDRLTFVDFWDDPHVACRIKSIPFKQMRQAATKVISKMKKPVKLQFKKIDIEANPEIATRYSIKEIPSLVVFWKGKAISRISGRVLLDDVKKMNNEIEAAIKKAN